MIKHLLSYLTRDRAHRAFHLTPLHATVHMLRWLDRHPLRAMCDIFNNYVKNMVSDSEIIEFRVTPNPDWLTGCKKNSKDERYPILTRTGLCFEFHMMVKTAARGTEPVVGTFTWVATGLDGGDRKQRYWIDVDGSLSRFGSSGILQFRLWIR